MITGTVRSTELFDVHLTRKEMTADHTVGVADTHDEFDRRARAWLAEHRPTATAGFTDYVTKLAWSGRTAPCGRLELTVSELHALADAVRNASHSPAVESLTAKINALAERVEFGTLIPTEPGTEGSDGDPGHH